MICAAKLSIMQHYVGSLQGNNVRLSADRLILGEVIITFNRSISLGAVIH